MTLSTEQWKAVEGGQAVELTIEGTRCVVVRQDVYAQVLSANDAAPRQAYAAVLKALDNFDESPEQYLEYLNE